MNKNIFENLPITIVMILISAGTSFAIVSTKVNVLEVNTKELTIDVDNLKTATSKQEIINQNIKETSDEIKSDVKELLRRVPRK